MVEFAGTPLERAVAEFNRYRSTPIIIADRRIASLLIGGRFPVGASDEFLAGLEAGFNVQAIEGDDGTIYLVSARKRVSS